MKFRSLGSSVGDAIYKQIGRANGRVQSQRSMPVDILENDRSYLVVFDAPGAQPEDVQVRYLEGSIRVQIDRFRRFYEGCEMRFPGRGMSLGGETELPRDAVVAPDAGTARLSETGTLSIEIPKRSAIDAENEAAEDDAASDPVDADAETEEVALDD